MLSICIPVYNYNINQLVFSLHKQALQLKVPVEINIADDYSKEEFRSLNRPLKDLELVKYWELPANAGRSRIRNLLCEKSGFQWLLYMDCDSMPPDEKFLQRYINAIKEQGVICGGRSYLPAPPADSTHFHWWYGKNREVTTAEYRNQDPYRSFMSNNFMVHKSIMKKIPFNELISGYGHEDTLFGYELKENNIPLKHINNPLLHTGLQEGLEFLNKTRQGITNLWKIHSLMGKPESFARMVRVLNTYNRLEKLKLSRFFCTLTGPLVPYMQKSFASQKPNLYYLDIYKLRLLCLEALNTKN